MRENGNCTYIKVKSALIQLPNIYYLISLQNNKKIRNKKVIF